MPRRHILSTRQRSALLDLPTDEAALLRHYILADDDLIHIDRRRDRRTASGSPCSCARCDIQAGPLLPAN